MKNTNPSSQRHDEKLLRVGFVNGDATQVQGEDMINISFDASTWVKAIITIKKTILLKDIIKKYMEKIGLPERLIGTEIFFLFNG